MTDKYKALREALDALPNDIDGLVAETGGVAWLHLNGGVAPWHDLTGYGRCREWLSSIETAREARGGGE